MELSLAVRTGIYQALLNNVTHNGEVVKAYDAYALPQTAEYPYILLSTQNNAQRNTKFVRPQDASIIVEVVTAYLQPVGRKTSEQIYEQVSAIINPDDRSQIDLSPYGYKIGDTINAGSTFLASKNDAYYVYRKLTTFNFIVSTV